MKAINGKLDMSKTYKLVSVEYGELSELHASQCDNCGQVIANVAIVQDNTGKTYGIGLDCMMTIVNMPASDQQQAKNTINRKRAFLKQLKYAELVEVSTNGIVFWFYTRGDDNQLHIRGKGDYSLYKRVISQLNIPTTFTGLELCARK
jgi:hypothetical protein